LENLCGVQELASLSRWILLKRILKKQVEDVNCIELAQI
jgi:hypothetical protein